MEKKIKAAGYIRVSTAIQATEGESLETQKTQITEYIAGKKTWELTKIYADEGATGTKVEYRTQFQQMIKDAKAGLFNMVVFTKLSRFARNARDYQNYAHELKVYNVDLISIYENVDPSTPTGKILVGMLALFAEWEHDIIREQFYENKMIRWKDNRAFIGQTPLGYKWNKVLNKLEVITEEAEIYKRIIRMYLDLGMAYRDIAVQLNKEGVTSIRTNKNGKERKRSNWGNQAISDMLKNPIYYGHYITNQWVYVDGKKGAGTIRSKEHKPESEFITIPVEEPLISKSEWDRLQKTAEDRKVKSKRTNDETKKFFLRDNLVCGRCGSKMNKRFGSTRVDGSYLRYYFCYYSGPEKRALETHRKKCTLPNIPAELLEKRIWNKVLSNFLIVQPKDFFKNLFDPEKIKQEINEAISAEFHFKAELSKNIAARATIKKLYGMDGIDINEMYEDLRKNKDDKITIEGKIIEANEKKVKSETLQKQAENVLKFLTTNRRQLARLRQDVDNLDPEDKKKLVEVMLHEPIVVDWVDEIQDAEHVAEYGNLIADYRLIFNFEIIKKFIDEGKIHQLNPYSSNYYSPSYTRRSPRDNKNSFGGWKD
jgi:DNA invertase Pin-like site-specific DNA recombinase